MARPKVMFTRKVLSVPKHLLDKIEEFRFAGRFRTESDAIRQLIQLGLDKHKAAHEGRCD